MRRVVQGIGTLLLGAGIAVGVMQAQPEAVDPAARALIATHEARISALETRVAAPAGGGGVVVRATMRPAPTFPPPSAYPTFPPPPTLTPVS